MKKFIGVLMLVLLVIVSAGCAKTPEREANDLGWSIVKSPITGRYYEVASRASGYGGYMAMSEVTKEEYEIYIGGRKYGTFR